MSLLHLVKCLPYRQCLPVASMGLQRMVKTTSYFQSLNLAQRYPWLNDIPNRPSDLWVNKMLTLFYRLDADRNGYLCDEDFKVFTARFENQDSLTKEQAIKAGDSFLTFWKMALKETKWIDIQEYIEERVPLVRDASFADNAWNTYIKEGAGNMFDAIDANGDGTFKLDDFITFFKCINLEDESYAKEIFDTLDLNGDGQILKDEFLHAFHDFFFNEGDSHYKELFGPLSYIETIETV